MQAISETLQKRLKQLTKYCSPTITYHVYMRKLFTSVILLLFITECLQAQFETNYTPMVSSGNLPKDFVTLSSQKYESEKASLSKKEKRGTRKSKEKFILQSNFGVDDILLSGRVLFNDPLSAYVNKVADKL